MPIFSIFECYFIWERMYFKEHAKVHSNKSNEKESAYYYELSVMQSRDWEMLQQFACKKEEAEKIKLN